MKWDRYEKIKIYKTMLASTYHILNNFIYQMQLFKLSAESTPEFDPEVLALYEDIIKDASTQIAAPGSIAGVDEVSIHASVAPGPDLQSGIEQSVAVDVKKPQR